MLHRLPRLAVLLAAASVLLAPATSAGAASGWTDPVRIRTQATGVEQIRVGVAADGRISIVGKDGLGVFALPQNGGGWHFIRLAVDPLIEGGIAGVFDRSGHAWLVYRHGCEGSDCTEAGLYLFTNRWGGPNDGWPAHPTLLVRGAAHDPAFQVAGTGRMHLAWMDKRGRLHYGTATHAAGPWTDTLVWGEDTGAYPAMVLDADGRPNLVAMRFPAALPGAFGAGWVRDVGMPGAPAFRTRMLPQTGEFDGPAFLALDADGHARVIWAHDPYCGVGPCPPEPTRGTWTRAWTGSRWSVARQLSGAYPLAIRFRPNGRAVVLTHRPSVVAETGAGWATTVLATRTVGYVHYVEAAALALTVNGAGRAVYADWLVDASWSSAGVFLSRER